MVDGGQASYVWCYGKTKEKKAGLSGQNWLNPPMCPAQPPVIATHNPQISAPPSCFPETVQCKSRSFRMSLSICHNRDMATLNVYLVNCLAASNDTQVLLPLHISHNSPIIHSMCMLNNSEHPLQEIWKAQRFPTASHSPVIR